MADRTNPILSKISRSVDKECCGGANFSNRSSEALDLGFERCGGIGHVNIVAEAFSGMWRRVWTPMEAVPPPNGRSAEEDSNGGAALWFRSPEDRVLECECGGGAWWRVGS